MPSSFDAIKVIRPTFETTIKGLWLASAFAGFGGFASATSCGAGAVRAAMQQLHTEPSQDLDF